HVEGRQFSCQCRVGVFVNIRSQEAIMTRSQQANNIHRNIAVAHHGDGWAEVWRCLLSSVLGGIGVEQPSDSSGTINTLNVSPWNRERSICAQSCSNDDSVVSIAQLLQCDLGAQCVH